MNKNILISLYEINLKAVMYKKGALYVTCVARSLEYEGY
jgi:hypothetical protein